MLEIQVDHAQVIVVDLYHNHFVNKWKKLFLKTVETCEVNQPESFIGNCSEHRAQQNLLDAITAINKFFNKDFIKVPATINWEDQNWYNYLHQIFEQLSGTWNNPTRLMTFANAQVREAIRNINFYVHRLEKRPYQQEASLFVSFNKDCYTRKKFDIEDYQYFQHHVESGQVYIHYAELGKTYLDLYEDGLPFDYAGAKNLHYYSAEIAIRLEPCKKELFDTGFYNWLQQNNIDINDKTLGIGILPIGQVKDVDKAGNIVYNGSRITNLRIDHGKTI
jgi:hypothetical protein